MLLQLEEGRHLMSRVLFLPIPPTATTACPRTQSRNQSLQREQLLPFLLYISLFLSFHQSLSAPCIAFGFPLVDSGACARALSLYTSSVDLFDFLLLPCFLTELGVETF